VELSIVDSLERVSAEDFDRLDSSAGSAACYQRTRQRERDGRWRCRYLYAADGGRLMAMLALYTANGRAWPDPAYDPSTWELPAGLRGDYAPGDCVLVGGFADLRTGFAVAEQAREPAVLGELLAGIAQFAAEQDRCLVFPYLLPDAQQAVTAATAGRIGWAPLAREARLARVSDADWYAGMPGEVRRNLRRDQKLIAAAGIVPSRHSWPEVEELASDVIAEHNVALGRFDHAEFVRMRNREWDACPGVELTVFGASTASVTGFVTALIWQDRLEAYEIGLRGEHGPQRFAAYLDLVFYQPLRTAQAAGLTDIRLGVTSERVKAGRGAVFADLRGGVLSLADTRCLAAPALPALPDHRDGELR
jgi:hypothetical protein